MIPVLDLRHLHCPMPALRTRKALAMLVPGARIEVHCTDPLAAIDIPHLLQGSGDVLEEMTERNEMLVFVIRKG